MEESRHEEVEVIDDIQGTATFLATNDFVKKKVDVKTDLIDTSFGK